MIHSQILYSDGVPVSVTVFDQRTGRLETALPGQHPNFDTIVARLQNDATDPDVLDLLNVEQAITQAFADQTDRVVVRNGVVYFDGDPIHNVVAEHIVRALQEGLSERVTALCNFLEKVMANPNQLSRNMAYEWLSSRNFTITPEGNVVGYKGCAVDENGEPVSTRTAPAADQVQVNGEPIINRRVPQPIGAVVTMPRSVVEFNPTVSCHRGLHVGTYDYAAGFSGGYILEVHVDPRDMVSVPLDHTSQKVRCCRYKVVRKIETPYREAVLTTSAYDDFWADEDYDYDDYDDDFSF